MLAFSLISKCKIKNLYNIKPFLRLYSSKPWSKVQNQKTNIKKDTDFDESPKVNLIGKFNEVTIEQEEYLYGTVKYFKDFDMNPELVRALSSIGKEKATSIQAAAYETIKSGKDTLIASETGSGKTLAYLLPIIDRILSDPQANTEYQYPNTVIIVPNKELCSQLYKMAKEVLDALKSHGRVITIDIASNFNGVWPYSSKEILSPNLLVCTPSYLANYIKGPNIINEDIFLNIKSIVLDEADMILEGDYLKHIEKIMEAFKVLRRGLIREGKIEIHEVILQKILSAATLPSYGLRSTEKYIEKNFPLAVKISNSHLHKHHPRIEQDFIALPPEAQDLFSSTERIEMIKEAIGDFSSKGVADRKGIMIFVNTAEAAACLYSRLTANGLPCAEYHKLIPNSQKEKELELFRSGEVPILVCTDHAARGLDLPGVYHVIQAEFALNVVAHLHRIGRASRAGKFGIATNFYGKESTDLVSSILSDTDEGKIDQSFSRRRGFRSKIKKEIKNQAAKIESENPENYNVEENDLK